MTLERGEYATFAQRVVSESSFTGKQCRWRPRLVVSSVSGRAGIP